LQGNDQSLAVLSHGNGASIVVQRRDFGSGGKTDRKLLAETGAQGKAQRRGTLAASGIQAMLGRVDRDDGTLDRLGPRNREGRALARPWLPERHELALEILEDGREPSETDVPHRRGDETPLLGPGVRLAGGEG